MTPRGVMLAMVIHDGHDRFRTQRFPNIDILLGNSALRLFVSFTNRANITHFERDERTFITLYAVQVISLATTTTCSFVDIIL